MRDRTEILRRKEQLINRCAAQRIALADVFHDLERPIALADRALNVVRFFTAHPLLLAAGVALVVGFRRRGAVGLIGRGLAAWRVWRGISALAGRMGMDFSRRRRRESTGNVAS